VEYYDIYPICNVLSQVYFWGAAATFFVHLKLSGVSIGLHHISITVYWYYQLKIN